MPEQSHLAVALVGPAPMHQEQASQVLELSKGKVAGQHSRAALPPTDAHPNVRCLDHAHVIGTIANACSNQANLPCLQQPGTDAMPATTGQMPAATGHGRGRAATSQDSQLLTCSKVFDTPGAIAYLGSSRRQVWQQCCAPRRPSTPLSVPAARALSRSAARHTCIPSALLLIPAPVMRSCANNATAGHRAGGAGPFK